MSSHTREELRMLRQVRFVPSIRSRAVRNRGTTPGLVVVHSVTALQIIGCDLFSLSTLSRSPILSQYLWSYRDIFDKSRCTSANLKFAILVDLKVKCGKKL